MVDWDMVLEFALALALALARVSNFKWMDWQWNVRELLRALMLRPVLPIVHCRTDHPINNLLTNLIAAIGVVA